MVLDIKDNIFKERNMVKVSSRGQMEALIMVNSKIIIFKGMASINGLMGENSMDNG